MSEVPRIHTQADEMMHHQQQSGSSTPMTSSSPINSSDHGALFTRLRNQVEFYFSSQNLARDTYLRNMLTAKHQEVPSPPPLQLMTPVAVITNFPKVRDICAAFGASISDPPHVLLARACEGSTVVSVSADGAWIGPVLQQLPPLTAPTPRMPPPTPQAHFPPGPYPPNPHHIMMPAGPMGEAPPMSYMGPHPVPVVQNVPLSRGSVSPSSNSLDSLSQGKETVVVVPDMPAECNPILLMTVFTTENIRPSSVTADAHSNTWYVSFSSEADAKAAITASSDKTVGGKPIKAKLKSEPPSARVSVASASGASLSSMSASQRQQIPVPQMVQQPVSMSGGAMMYPPGAYPMHQPSPPPHMQPGMPPYPISGSQYMTPMTMPGQPFPPYPQHMQPMYPYGYMPQHGQPPFPMNQPPMMRYGPGVPPPPPRYPGPPYPYQHGPQHPHTGDGPGHYYGQPSRLHSGEGRGPNGDAHEGGQKKNDHTGKKKKNRYNKQASNSSLEGGHNEQFGKKHTSRENASSPNNFGRGKGRHGGSASPAVNRHQRNSNNSSSRNASQADSDKSQNENKEIFTATDFPGLSGDMAAQRSQQVEGSCQKNEHKIFSGYADALLKKKDTDWKEDQDSNATKDLDTSEVDSITRQTEAMEREILSDFHDLRIPGDEDYRQQNDTDSSKIKGETSKPKPFDHLPILPGMSDIGQSLSLDTEPIQSSALHLPENGSEKVINFNPLESSQPATARDPLPSAIPSQRKEEESPAPAGGAWGSKRLFSDVRFVFTFIYLTHSENRELTFYLFFSGYQG